MRFAITSQCLAALEEQITQIRIRGNNTAREGYISGSEQDGHHDEGYQLSLRETSVHDRMLGELVKLRASVYLINPTEQCNTVQIGNGVTLTFGDNSMMKFIVEGRVVGNFTERRVSIYSPLGKAIAGAEIGETRSFSVGNQRKEATIREIILPSLAVNFLS